jgi:uncharacterized protein YdaU (DUF1376 family)
MAIAFSAHLAIVYDSVEICYRYDSHSLPSQKGSIQMGLPYMPFFVGDYLAETRLLNGQQHGAYLLLIFQLWQRGSLPFDDKSLAKIACVTLRQWKKIKPVISPYFTDTWEHHKVTKVRAKAIEISGKRRAIALEQHSNSRAKAEHLQSNDTAKAVHLNLSQSKPKKNQLIDSMGQDEAEITMALRKKITDKFLARGLTPPDHLANIGLWVALGDSPSVILAAVDVGLEQRGAQFSSMNYISIVLEKNRKQSKPEASLPFSDGSNFKKDLGAGGVAATPDPKPGSDEWYRAILALHRKSIDYWPINDFTGFRPSRPGCKVPARLLEEFGFPPTPPYPRDPVENKKKIDT